MHQRQGKGKVKVKDSQEEQLDEAEQLIAAFEGTAAFYAHNLTSGAVFAHAPDRTMPTASTIKLLVLAAFFQAVEAGRCQLTEPLPIAPDDVRGGSGILKDLSPDLVLTARDHATLMIALSDNTSTAVLVRRLGLDRILAAAREWGMTQTTATFIMGGSSRDYATSTPRDIAHLLILIATGRILSEKSRAAIGDILLTQQYHDQLARFLPFNQYDRRGNDHPGPVVVRSKSGFSGSGARVDAGIIDLPAGVRYVICVMNEGSADRFFTPQHPGALLNGQLSYLVFKQWWPAAIAFPNQQRMTGSPDDAAQEEHDSP